jgi:hypothetical protein
MLIYGDRARVEPFEAKRHSVLAALGAIRAEPPGLARHAALVSAFVEASELVQGIADSECEAHGGDDVRSSLQDQAMGLLLDFARAVARSWSGGFKDPEAPGSDLAASIEALHHPAAIRTKTAEGYAFYALYPECYLAAAAHSGLGPRTRVIGLRSIGVGLAALVAAALDAPPPVTLRPTGHPFRREVRIAPGLASDLLADAGASFAVADEGPGLSGSSFGCVADWLEARGVARERIHFFPSHRGDLGPHASAAHRERWASAQKHCVEMDDLLLGSSNPGHRLDTWLTERIGPIQQPLGDISGGRWRRVRSCDEGAWPPSNIQQERRKFLAQSQGATWIAKFAGLGREGHRKLWMARTLHEAGFAPDVKTLCHGFLVQSWCNARPLNIETFGRERLIDVVGSYLGFRAQRFPASSDAGASLAELSRMAVHNTRLALGDAAGAALVLKIGQGADLEARVRRVHTDNRLHLWEWLVLDDGRLLKADALDHSAAHDLVGCQDIAWDVAGAIVEFGLTDDEGAGVCARVERTGQPVDRDLLAFLTPCYLAFHLGASTLAADTVAGAEAHRLRLAAQGYAARLSRFIKEPLGNAGAGGLG